ncbi:MAG: O-methyltransferase [Spartobacteria bacterium]
MSELFVKYPQLSNLRALIPDDLIYSEIGSRADEFESYLADAKNCIPTVNLNKVFPGELEKGEIKLENFLGHWGNVSIEELCKICLIVKWLKPRRILEMGTYNGMTTLQMALNSPKECITYTLDLTPDEAANLKLGKLDDLVANQFKNKFQTATGSYFAGRKDVSIEQLWGNTASFDYSLLDGPMDLVFVDAAHDYENKKIDCERAFSLLSPNGVILWHDYAQVANPDVTRCLGEFAKDRRIFHLRNTNLAVFYAG